MEAATSQASSMLMIGTGAIASFLLPKLFGAGVSLQIFGSASPRLQALSSWTAPQWCAVSQPEAVAEHREWVVACKSWQNGEKVTRLRKAPPPERILVLQNGLEPEHAWRELGAGVERGLVFYGVASVGPGRVSGGKHGEITLERGSCWAEPLRAAGLEIVERDDMACAVWRKLVVNASLNVVAALHDLRNGEVLTLPAARRKAFLAAREVAHLAAVLGVDLGPEEPEAMVENVASMTADNICSTLADLRAERPTEYDSINGALLRLAAAHSQRMPLLQQLDEEFGALLSHRRGRKEAS